MGTDIVLLVEIWDEKNQVWQQIELPDTATFNTRSYALFSCLAGVRGDKTPVVEPRDFPTDASESARKCFDDFCKENGSPDVTTWLSLDEADPETNVKYWSGSETATALVSLPLYLRFVATAGGESKMTEAQRKDKLCQFHDISPMTVLIVRESKVKEFCDMFEPECYDQVRVKAGYSSRSDARIKSIPKGWTAFVQDVRKRVAEQGGKEAKGRLVMWFWS
jgi:hypothetical protein